MDRPPMGAVVDIRSLTEPPTAARVLHRDEYLIRAGSSRGPIFQVTSGCLMSYFDDDLGREHVAGFHLPGEYIGLHCMHLEHYPYDVIALDTAGLRAIEDTDRLVPSQWRAAFLDALGREIQRVYYFMGDITAEARFAAFLLDFSDRVSRKGQSKTHFLMPMSRGQIGNYLRLTPSTVSRLVTSLRASGVINAIGREIEILDMPALETLSGHFMDKYFSGRRVS